jgi:hypothetical protein
MINNPKCLELLELLKNELLWQLKDNLELRRSKPLPVLSLMNGGSDNYSRMLVGAP